MSNLTQTARPAASTATGATIYNITVAAANTEYSHSFSSGVKAFEISFRTYGELKYSFTSGQSGTVYRTLWRGTNYSKDSVLLQSLTIYFQSPKTGVVEIKEWV